MLRKLFSSSSESFSAAEEASVNRLADASACQGIKGGAGIASCDNGECWAAYLVAAEAAARQLQISPASRTYRANLPLNYRSLFPSEARSYRVDVLEASLDHYNIIWVNGEKFEFTAEAVRRAEELRAAWSDLGAVLERWSSTPKTGRPTRKEITSALKSLDSAWANFEERYLTELVQIEAKARNHIVHAIELERRLQLLENQHHQDLPEYREAQRRLVSAVNRLNSVANINRKGRDDLGFETLVEARSILHKCSSAGSAHQGSISLLSAAKVLATDVVESFNAMRHYLRDVTYCLERIDPHLGNNSGLVARLVDWEECWEVGTAYLQQKRMLRALCDAVAEIRRIQVFAPKLAEMCEECDVELFMVLPRLLWLRFLADPQEQMPLLAHLLPHRFVEASSAAPSLGTELQAFFAKYTELERSLASMLESSVRSDLGCIRSLLAKSVVSGGDDETDSGSIYAGVRAAHVNDAKKQVRGFMHELESWSMELQRHCPEDWNQYSAVLLHCLRTETDKERSGPFSV